MVEKARAKATVKPNCLKNWPTTSPMEPIGTKTAIKDSEVAKIASDSSSVASWAALIGDLPISICLKIFSIKTIASSIRIPTAKLRAIKDILFKVKPIDFIKKKVAIIEVGMDKPPMMVALKSRKNI